MSKYTNFKKKTGLNTQDFKSIDLSKIDDVTFKKIEAQEQFEKKCLENGYDIAINWLKNFTKIKSDKEALLFIGR